MTANAYPALAAVRDHLATLEGVNTCAIGLEANMTPADYPMIRIVPSRLSNGPSLTSRMAEALIYFGQPVHEFGEGLEAQWSILLQMESTMLLALRAVPGVRHVKYLETVLDEDRIDAFKLLAIRCEITA